MKVQTLWIPHRLPGLNEIIEEARKHRMASAQQKSYWTGIVKMLAKGLYPMESAFFRYTWIEKNRRRDKSNIACGRKFIEDGLIEAGILKNDGWKQILGFEDKFQVGPSEGVKVEIYEGIVIQVEERG